MFPNPPVRRPILPKKTAYDAGGSGGCALRQTARQEQAERENRHCRRQAVDAIEHAAVARQQVTAVLATYTPFEHADRQIADDRHERCRKPYGQPDEPAKPEPDPCDRCDERRADQAADDAFPGLIGADCRCEFDAPELLPGEIGADVGRPDDRERAHDERGSDRGALVHVGEQEPARQQRQ